MLGSCSSLQRLPRPRGASAWAAGRASPQGGGHGAALCPSGPIQLQAQGPGSNNRPRRRPFPSGKSASRPGHVAARRRRSAAQRRTDPATPSRHPPGPRRTGPRGLLRGRAASSRHRRRLPGSRDTSRGRRKRGAPRMRSRAGPRGAGPEGSLGPFPGWVAAAAAAPAPAPCRAPWFPSVASRTWRRLATSCVRTAARAALRPPRRAVSPPRGAGELGARWGPTRPRGARVGAAAAGLSSAVPSGLRAAGVSTPLGDSRPAAGACPGGGRAPLPGGRSRGCLTARPGLPAGLWARLSSLSQPSPSSQGCAGRSRGSLGARHPYCDKGP